MIGGLVSRFTGLFDNFASSAVLLREAARTSRRWQTYASRAGFSGALFGVLLLGIWTAVNAPFVDISNISYAGRAIFVAFSAVLLLLAIVFAPLMTSSAMIEEAQDRTLEMLILSKLAPSQILSGKVLSRILILITIVFGAMPVMAMVVTLGGVAPQAVVAVVIHALTAVVVVGSLGAFYGLFTKSPMLAMLASATYAIPIFLFLPAGYVLCTGHPNDAVHFSLFGGPAAEDWSSIVAPLSYLPSLGVIFVIGTRLFDLKVSSADIRRAFSSETWGTKTWAIGLGVAVASGLTVLPLASAGAWTIRFGTNHRTLLVQLGIVACVGVIWAWWTLALTLATWALLRVGVDVVDAMDAILGGRGKRKRDRRNFRVWSNPIAWREARPAAWGSNGVPVIATWLLIMLGMLQTGWWIIPGGSLAMGIMNTLAAAALTLWLVAKTVEEERRNKSLEVILTTVMASPRILIGKAAGVAVPTFPLLLLSGPFFIFGYPHLHMFDVNGGSSFGHFVEGACAWVWTFGIWTVLLWGGMMAALRVRRSRGGFAVAGGALLAVLGVPAVLGRLFEEVAVIAIPCRLIAPPLAGGAEPWQYVLSTMFWTFLGVSFFLYGSLGLRRWISAGLAGLVGLLLLGTPDVALAQQTKLVLQDDFLMVAEPVGEGIVRAGEWAALRVKIQNRGKNAVGRLVVTERSGTTVQTYARPVEIQQGVRKDVVLLYRPNASSRDREVVLETNTGRLARAAFRLQQARPEDGTVAVLGIDMLGIQRIRRTGEAIPGRRPRHVESERTIHTALVEPGVLPQHSAGWGAFDQIVWPAADPTTMDPEQLRALQHYVADGGHLLLTVTENVAAVKGSALESMLPVRLGGTRDAVGLDRFVIGLGGRPDPRPVPMAEMTLDVRPGRDAYVLARAEDGSPLWVTGTYGLGTISVLALDPRVEPIRGNTDPERTWRTLLHLPDPSGRPTFASEGVHRFNDGTLHSWSDPAVQREHVLNALPPTSSSILAGFAQFGGPVDYDHYDATVVERHGYGVRAWLADIPGVAPLPMSWLLIFSGVYLFMIGPADWFLLRAIRKQPWTWVTFPVTIVLFSAVALGGTAYMKGSQAIVSTVEFIDVLPGTDLWRGEAHVGVFATRRTRVSLETTVEDSVAQSIEGSGYALDPSMSGGFGPGQLNYGTDTWTLGYGTLQWTDTAPGTVDVERDGEGWAITNNMPFALRSSEIVVPHLNRIYSVGDLDPGQRIVVSTDFSNLTPGVSDEESHPWLRQYGVDAPTEGRGYLQVADTRLVFVASIDRVVDLKVGGVSPTHRNRSLLRVPLTPGMDPAHSQPATLPSLGAPL